MKKYAAIYLDKATTIAKRFHPHKIVTLQFFQRQDQAMLGGMKQVLQLLKKATDITQYQIKYLPDGTIIDRQEVVLELKGPYHLFGLYEGIIDGILARGTSLATNAYQIAQSTNKPIIYMGDRADYFCNQEFDGYAVALGGITTQVTPAHVAHHQGIAMGTMPHALIQNFNGDLVQALHAYAATFPGDKLVALVDFHNDVVQETLKVLAVFGSDLHAVRVDTGANMVDASLVKSQEFGVTPNLIKILRKKLDAHHGRHVKIIVSSGFDAAKIRNFEQQQTPVDYYGVGKAVLTINHSFTADAVLLDDKPMAKAGRQYRPNQKMQLFC